MNQVIAGLIGILIGVVLAIGAYGAANLIIKVMDTIEK